MPETASTTQPLRFSVLGPVRVWRGTSELDLGPAQRRALVALLLLRAGRPVDVDDIINVLWGQEPPPSAKNVVHRHVGAVRRLLEPGLPARSAGRWLTSSGGSYRLKVDASTVDLLQFQELVQRARHEADGGRAQHAVELLVEALGLWQGPAAAGVPADIRARAESVTLEHQRLAAVMDAADLALRSGTSMAVIALLEEEAERRPRDESLHSRLIKALDAVGRHTDALAAHRTISSLLLDELGIDPGPELAAAHDHITRRRTPPTGSGSAADDHAESTVPDTTGTSARPATPVMPVTPRPAQLPPVLTWFVGRKTELTQIHGLLPPEADTTGAPAIICLSGMAGMGKTTLAVHWAHEVAHRFPDGQLYADLRGFDPTGAVAHPAEPLREFLQALGVAAQHIPSTLSRQTDLFRQLLQGRRMLIVLDNVRDSSQILPLLAAPPGNLTLVTSRNQLTRLVVTHGARPVSLSPLSTEEARDTLARRMGASWESADAAAADRVVQHCGGLPLALAIVAARAAANPAWPLSRIASELRDSKDVLDSLSCPDDPVIDIRTVFSWSYNALSTTAARLFRLLSVHPGPDISTRAAADLAGLTVAEARPLLTELVRYHLLMEPQPGRFAFHDLLRVYADEMSRDHDGAVLRQTALVRSLDHYLYVAHAAARLVRPHRPAIALPEDPRRSSQPFADLDQALTWLAAEQAVLIRMVDRTASHEEDRHAWQLAWSVEGFLDRRGHWHDQIAVQRAALNASLRAGILAGQAHTRRNLGFAHARLGRCHEAHPHLHTALQLFERLGDIGNQAHVHRLIGWTHETQDDRRAGLRHARDALALHRADADDAGEAVALNAIGWNLAQLGNHQGALRYCARALTVQQRLGDRRGEAATLDTIAYAHIGLGQHEESMRYYDRALSLFRGLGDLINEAQTLVRIGELHDAVGAPTAARTAWLAALDVLHLGHPQTDELRRRLDFLG
ncbi:AfsR/SARP family transcriptional regulator [Streptomyces shenzhenensis]|uniref:AfsR/SARP family transcriptional regulator n=1 Tax=Streptomyces shenzhenensis TaxID=943815 RepID=UPI003D8D7FDF